MLCPSYWHVSSQQNNAAAAHEQRMEALVANGYKPPDDETAAAVSDVELDDADFQWSAGGFIIYISYSTGALLYTNVSLLHISLFVLHIRVQKCAKMHP